MPSGPSAEDAAERVEVKLKGVLQLQASGCNQRVLRSTSAQSRPTEVLSNTQPTFARVSCLEAVGAKAAEPARPGEQLAASRLNTITADV